MTKEIIRDISPLMPKLLDGEELRSVKIIDDPMPERLPSGLGELQRLARASNPNEIGDFGPVLASLSLDSLQQSDPESHRYEVVFGRDSLRTAIDLIKPFPRLARVTLKMLAENQGVENDTQREEEPGRIAHEIRDPEIDAIARRLTKEQGWGWPYFGSVDATPEFICTFAAYCQQTHNPEVFLGQKYIGRDGAEHTMADAFLRAVEWVENRIDSNTEGLLEYKHLSPGGIKNQVWKDSPDSYFHKDGTFANFEDGIASIEVQRLAYDALLSAAEMHDQLLLDSERADRFRLKAQRVKDLIMKRFWTEDQGGYFVIGTDRSPEGKLRQLEIKTSNMGHLLHSRLLEGDDEEVVAKREAIISQLLSEKMMSLNGIRTLANDEVRYRPGSYHNGSVWIWDNYFISQGLSLHGYHNLSHLVNDRLLDDVNSTRRFPEYLRGDNDPRFRLNMRLIDVYDHKNDFLNHLEQPPQDIQAWSVAAILSLKIRRGRGQHMTVDPHKLALEQRLLRNLGL